MIRVKPISVDNVHVVIICPFCNKKHTHGSCGGQGYAGSRVPHCEQSEDREYYIEKMEVDPNGK